MEAHFRCPNCGRNLTNEELYCYFCEMDLVKLRKKSKDSGKNIQKDKNLEKS
jgi:hypothetical protein